MTEIEQVRHDAYTQVVQLAKNEYDELAPLFKKINDRLMRLRILINAGSGLVGLDVPEKYQYGHAHWNKPTETRRHG